ncbi:hypothetical protein CEW87_21930 [Parazoarcus communis]|uniref:Uncharacterized protein n=1 Tax=Parazoarcus communis TaxID=41977 RepID=A0A2U8H9K2_9RHOO|nr:hypothetical protein [Parazoarcus communis]AWI81776.1 hypothetical protein CEW87_21930 [Parazoarcus communis]
MPRKNLPYLDQERLNYIFEAVYDPLPENAAETLYGDDKMASLLCALKSAQGFNHRFRWDDTCDLFHQFDPILNFAHHTEGTTLWLAMILAIQELYGFSDEKMRNLMKIMTIRK